MTTQLVSILVLVDVGLRQHKFYTDFGKILPIIPCFSSIKILLYIYQTLYKDKKKKVKHKYSCNSNQHIFLNSLLF
jgi:hypothetical protein